MPLTVSPIRILFCMAMVAILNDMDTPAELSAPIVEGIDQADVVLKEHQGHIDEARTADTWFEKSMPSEDRPSEDLYLSPGSLDIRPENCMESLSTTEACASSMDRPEDENSVRYTNSPVDEIWVLVDISGVQEREARRISVAMLG